MIFNLCEHFDFDLHDHGIWHPVLSGKNPPEHWRGKDQPVKGIEKGSGSHYFEQKYRLYKRNHINSNLLIVSPPRRTDNFGLDLLVRDSNNTDPGGDFFQLYYGGYAARWGLSIFENDTDVSDTQKAAQLKELIPFHPPNRYPPGFIYSIGIILSLFSPWTAYFVWVIIHEIVLGFCLYISWRLCGRDRNIFLTVAIMWLAFLPWYLELYMGQTTFLIMAGTFVIGAFLLNKQSPVSAGSWWTVTLLTKPLTLLYTPLLIKLKRFKMLMAGIGILVTSTLIYFLYKPGDCSVFFEWAFGQKMVSSLGNLCFQNLVFHFFLSDTIVQMISVVVVVLGLYYTFFSRPFNSVRILCLWICVYFLGYAHVWEHHQVLLLSVTILPFIMTRKYRYIIPWLLAAVPSPFYLLEGQWNWNCEVLYLTSGVLSPMVLMMLLIFCRFDSDEG